MIYRILLTLVLLTSPAFAELSDFTTPPNIATDNAAWRAWRDARRAEFEANCPLERATTYYFDAEGGPTQGDDITGDGSINDPWETRAKAITVDGPGVRLRFNRGDVWRESGNWVVGDDVTIDAYGTGDDPVFDRFTSEIVSGGSTWGFLSGQRRQATFSAFEPAWIKIRSLPLTRPLQRVADATAVSNTTDSWCWTSNVIYINMGADDPNTFDIDICPSNGDNGTEHGVELAGDGSRVEGITFYGWGCSKTDTSSQSQGVTSSAGSDEANLAKDCRCFYSGSHALAHNGVTGGRFLVLDCHAGYCIPNSSGETIFNSYATNGEQEVWFIGCDVDYGTLPASDWVTATFKLQGNGFYTHTSGNETPLALFVVDNCVAHSENLYGPQQLAHANNLPTLTDTDLTTYRCFFTYNTQNMAPAGRLPTNSFLFTTGAIFYNNDFGLWPAVTNTALDNGVVRINVWMIQNRFTIDMTTMGNNPFGFYNPATGTDFYEIFWYHNWTELNNVSGTNPSRFGIDFDIRAQTSATGLGVPGAGTSKDCKYVNNVLVVNKTTGGNVYYVGVNNTNKCKSNRLYGITASDGIERGYNLHDPATTVLGTAPVWEVENSGLLEAGSTELVLSHDFNNKRRTVATPDIGPVDFSSPTFRTHILQGRGTHSGVGIGIGL
jgi:hypothetical protein